MDTWILCLKILGAILISTLILVLMEKSTSIVLAQTANLVEQERILTLVIGSKRFHRSLPKASADITAGRLSSAGFALIEVLVAIAILAILLATAVISIPSHDERYWRENLDQLVTSLNLAQTESAMSGISTTVQIDAVGWRFSIPNASAIMSDNSNVVSTSGLLPQVYQPQVWYKPVQMTAVQLTLGDEQVVSVLQIPIAQEQRRAVLVRNRNGRFSWNP